MSSLGSEKDERAGSEASHSQRNEDTQDTKYGHFKGHDNKNSTDKTALISQHKETKVREGCIRPAHRDPGVSAAPRHSRVSSTGLVGLNKPSRANYFLVRLITLVLKTILIRSNLLGVQ